MTTEIIPQATAGEKEAAAIMAQANQHDVTDEATAANMTRLTEYCDDKVKSMEKARLSLTGPLNKQVKFINSQFKGAKAAFLEASAAGRAKLKPYLLKLQRERDAAEAEARKRAKEAADRALEEQLEREATERAELAAAQKAMDAATQQPLGAEFDPPFDPSPADDAPPPPPPDDAGPIEKGGPPIEGGPVKRDGPLDEPPPAPLPNLPLNPRGAKKKAGTRKINKWRVTDIEQVPRNFMVLDNVLVNEAHKNGEYIPGIEYYTDEEVVLR